MVYDDEQQVFCANPHCELRLHVRVGDPGVSGAGNWAEVNGELWIGRSRVNNHFYCDTCRDQMASDSTDST